MAFFLHKKDKDLSFIMKISIPEGLIEPAGPYFLSHPGNQEQEITTHI